jgi:2-polyprenyl-3-methyl-5-hydroxy-6-metoxy-1,4-benzoquinol methylase
LKSTEHFQDPVAAYSQLAPHYADLSRRREPYLRSIEKIIVWRVPPNSKSLLDIGAGDGVRALRIARKCGIHDIVLVEPSLDMAARAEGIQKIKIKIWNVRAEDLGAKSSGCSTFGDDGSRPGTHENETAQRFDVITCLWNVLGHIRTVEDRKRAMCGMAAHLMPGGKCFLDVNHRYNLRSHGVIASAARFIRDSVFYKETNADVIAAWDIGGSSISTHGHVFTDREVRQLASVTDLIVEDRIVVDYDTGKIRRFAFEGNLIYVFRRSSRTDSSSAPQTS